MACLDFLGRVEMTDVVPIDHGTSYLSSAVVVGQVECQVVGCEDIIMAGARAARKNYYVPREGLKFIVGIFQILSNNARLFYWFVSP